jgi:hypothetical protein
MVYEFPSVVSPEYSWQITYVQLLVGGGKREQVMMSPLTDNNQGYFSGL